MICNASSVDVARLNKALRERGTTGTQVSREIGFNNNYICNQSRRGYLRSIVIKYLYDKYGIEYDEIKPVETQENLVEPEIDEPEAENVSISEIRAEMQEIKSILNDISMSLHHIGNFEIQILEKLPNKEDRR